MSKKTADKDLVSGLFESNAADWLDQHPGQEHGTWLSFDQPATQPLLPVVEPAAESEIRPYWRSLRTFFHSGKGGGLPTGKDAFQPYPALLLPFLQQSFLQSDYPCWVSDGSKEADPFHALSDFLEIHIDRLDLETETARILRDNQARLETIIRNKLSLVDDVFKARPVVLEALTELEEQLAIGGAEGKAFSKGLEQFGRLLPAGGFFVPFSDLAPLQLLAVIVGHRLQATRQSVRASIAQLQNRLEEILTVEEQKRPEAHDPEHLQATLDFADTFLNFEELAAVLPSGAAQAIPEERRQRIRKVLETLHEADQLLFRRDAFVTCAEDWPPTKGIDWKRSFPRFELQTADPGSLTGSLVSTFDAVMRDAARLFAAIRIGNLELENAYAADIHSDFFGHFTWREFSDEELAACAPVLLLADEHDLLGDELDDFSRVLASSRPVKLLIYKSGRAKVSAGGFAFRQELGALAVAHRNTFVLQTAILKVNGLYRGLLRGLSGSSPALFYLLSPIAGAEASRQPNLWLSAAVEGREFPYFIYDSQGGPKWGNRFEVQLNPEFEADWPGHELQVQKEKAEATSLRLPFTFADFAAQDLRYIHYFHLVPPKFWTDDLVPLAEYLQLEADALLRKIPYIWLIDENKHLQRAAVAWPLVMTCRERLDLWHYLQENAGVHNYHVEQATEQLRKTLTAAADKKIAELQANFKKELEEARATSAREAMERLADVLLEIDTETVLPVAPTIKREVAQKTAAPEPEPEIEATAESAAPPPAKEAEGISDLGEAWIETPLCTSCNECIDTNRQIFQYDGQKQAYIADLKGGPFADIVKAAENCPVGIIHPGAPQHPDEPNLKELIQRAAPFQA